MSFERQDEVAQKDLEGRKHLLIAGQKPKVMEAVRRLQKSVSLSFDVHSAER